MQVLKINSDRKDIDSFTIDDFVLLDYNPLKKLAMEMAV